MKTSKHDKNTSSSIDWQDLCESCSEVNGKKFKTQRGLLTYIYDVHDKSPTAMAIFFGVAISTMRNKLIAEGVHKNIHYKKSRQPIGELRKALREIPKDEIKTMTVRHLKEMFPEHNPANITRLLRKDNIVYRKRYYWARQDELKRKINYGDM